MPKADEVGSDKARCACLKCDCRTVKECVEENNADCACDGKCCDPDAPKVGDGDVDELQEWLHTQQSPDQERRRLQPATPFVPPSRRRELQPVGHI